MMTMVGARISRVGIVALSLFAAMVVVVGCGSDGEQRRSATAVLGAELPVAPSGSAYGPIYETLGELTAVSELIITGEVTSQVSIGTPDAQDDPNASEYFRLTIGVERTLKGAPAPTGEVSLVWEGFITEVTDGGTWASGTRTRLFRVAPYGVSMPDAGDRLMLFQSPAKAEDGASWGGSISHYPHGLEGVLWAEEYGRLFTEHLGPNRPAQPLIGLTIDEAAELIEVEAARPLTPAECENMRSNAEHFGVVVAELRECPEARDL